MKAILFLSVFISFQSVATEQGFCFECVPRLVGKFFTPVLENVNNIHKVREDILFCEEYKRNPPSINYDQKCSVSKFNERNTNLLNFTGSLKQQIQDVKGQLEKHFIEEGNRYITLYGKWKSLKDDLSACLRDLNTLKQRKTQ